MDHGSESHYVNRVNQKIDNEIHADVDRYINDLFDDEDEALIETQRSMRDANLPAISVSASQGRYLQLLARACNAQRILEIGTLAGYSTIWLARALPRTGTLITLELDPERAGLARRNIEHAGHEERIRIRVGPAIDSLRSLVTERAGPFDLIFIDADKQNYIEYFNLSLQLSRPGTLIIADNVVRKGKVADPDNEEERIVAIREFNKVFASTEGLTKGILQTVGAKGYDGMAYAVVERVPD